MPVLSGCDVERLYVPTSYHLADRTATYVQYTNNNVTITRSSAVAERPRMLCDIEYFEKCRSLKITRNDILE